MRIAFASFALSALLLIGCGGESTPEPAAPPPATGAPEPAAPAPASTPDASPPAPAESGAPTEPATQTPAPESGAAPTDAAPATAATPAPAEPASDNTAPKAAASSATLPAGPPPREGVDYTVIEPAAPFTPGNDRIEVVEVFAYYCIHCATLQAQINGWKPTLASDVEFRYLPMAHGQAEPIARAFFAADAMGVLDRTHDAMFKALAVERRMKQGSAEEIAGFYAEQGVDRDALLATMRSFAVNAQIARAQKIVARWAIEATPTIVVNGRYRVTVTNDRGHAGMLGAVEHLVARERAAAGTARAP